MGDSHDSAMDSEIVEGDTHQFLVRWREEQTGSLQFLGQLSESLPDVGSLFFYLGYDRAGKKLLVNFHLRFKVNPASKGVRSLFLATPVKHLGVELVNTMSGLDALDHDPRVVQEFQKAGMDCSSKIFRLSFTLKELGYVTMPLQGFTKTMTTKSKGLLLSLRSLSRTKEFQVYLPYSSEENLNVLRECSKMSREEGLQMPTIDYDTAYHRRAWGRDQWSLYHLQSDETLPATWNPLVDDSPPSYEEVARLTPPSNHKASESKSDLCSVGTNGRSEAVTPGEYETPPAGQLMPIPPSALPDPGTTGLSAAAEGERHSRGRKRKASQASLSDHHNHQAEEQSAAHPKEQNEWDRSTQRPAGQPSAPGSQRIPSNSQSTFISDRSVIDGGPNRMLFDDVQYGHFCNAVAWLTAAWYVQPDAHEAFLPELGMLAQAARERDLERYEHIRINCMYTLCQRERTSEYSGPFHNAFTIDDQIWHIFDFVFRKIGPKSDLLILDELVALSDVARAWKQIGQPNWSDGWQHYNLMFTTQMAVCILVALYKDERDWFEAATKTQAE